MQGNKGQHLAQTCGFVVNKAGAIVYNVYILWLKRLCGIHENDWFLFLKVFTHSRVCFDVSAWCEIPLQLGLPSRYIWIFHYGILMCCIQSSQKFQHECQSRFISMGRTPQYSISVPPTEYKNDVWQSNKRDFYAPCLNNCDNTSGNQGLDKPTIHTPQHSSIVDRRYQTSQSLKSWNPQPQYFQHASQTELEFEQQQLLRQAWVMAVDPKSQRKYWYNR